MRDTNIKEPTVKESVTSGKLGKKRKLSWK